MLTRLFVATLLARVLTASIGQGGGGSATPAGSDGQVQYNLSDALAASSSFVINTTALPVPAAPTLGTVGTTGSTTYGYTIVAKNLIGGSAPSAEATIATGNATLSAMNYVTVTVPACSDERVTGFDIYRTTHAAIGLIAQNVACGSTTNDTGLSVIQPFTSTPSSDYSQGIGSDLPYVNTSAGSCFGTNCFANNDILFPFQNSGTGLSVLSRTSASEFDYIGLFSDVIVDSTNHVAYAAAFDLEVYADQNVNSAAMQVEAFVYGKTISANLIGVPVYLLPQSGSVISGAVIGFYSKLQASTVTIDDSYSFYAAAPTASDGSTFTSAYQFYSPDLAASGTSGVNYAANSYYEWLDSRGVYRIREDSTFDSVGQAISALYNPQFTKYTPGATNFERCIPGCQWNGNVAEFGTEEGGTGTLRPVRFIGDDHRFASLTSTGATVGMKSVCVATATGKVTAAITGTGCGNSTPPTSSWTWDNQDAATEDATSGASIYLDLPMETGAIRMRYRTAPATPYTIKAKFATDFGSTSSNGTALDFGFRDSGGKYVTWHVSSNGNIYTQKWNSATSASTAYTTLASTFWTNNIKELAITDNGTNLIFQYRLTEDDNWITFDTRARGDFLSTGPNAIAWGGYVNDAPMRASLVSWVQE